MTDCIGLAKWRVKMKVTGSVERIKHFEIEDRRCCSSGGVGGAVISLNGEILEKVSIFKFGY